MLNIRNANIVGDKARASSTANLRRATPLALGPSAAMTPEQLLTFAYVAEAGNISRAAELLPPIAAGGVRPAARIAGGVRRALVPAQRSRHRVDVGG